ncbi:MAG: hypothetical protein ISN28_13570 [Ectothiorhodospiraceae bacterium AqS1]|nr:hypothetical protein [Ectothiorhodospiraceae bacterium AqS1]
MRDAKPAEPDAKGFKVGTVISAAAAANGGSMALAALDIESALDADLRVERIDGPGIRFQSPAWLDPTNPA